ncbi:MAG TPA: aminodeoxychorismate synthase component I [Allosphingosinicella sp.]|jgi:para-aminobenzoate synthetase/4-amino-4-deoxychorismate lyase
MLYREPVEIVQAWRPEEVRPALERLRAAGTEAAGFLAYEAGHALEPAVSALDGATETPLLWFGLFEGGEAVDLETLPQPDGAWASRPRPLVAPDDYLRAVETVQEHILEGDVYQANLTFEAEVATAGHPIALYAALRRRARAGWGGIVFTGTRWLLSFSPELFFTLESGRITARPMKGTAPAGSDPEGLRSDPKQRAENLMIVDLLRNDLSRVAARGSVAVPRLFEVEEYPTVQQMTSTVTAQLRDGLGPVDLLQAIFPCGSITGAPKIRAQQILNGLERRARGVYTGSIGRIAPDGDAAFNVAIRTLVLRDGETRARLGLGSGIVADSRPADEWRECLAKGAFVETDRSFDLIETMRFDPHDGIAELERHLARMKASAEALGFVFDRHGARNELQAATFALRAPRKLRLRLSRTGAIAIETRPLPGAPEGSVEVALALLPVDPSDFRLRHKTSDRAFYDAPRETSGAFETLFVDAAGFITEGSFTNVFVKRDDMLLTPPLTRGLLPGILRERLLSEGRALEAELREDDLRDGFLIGNSLRGLMGAQLRSVSP